MFLVVEPEQCDVEGKLCSPPNTNEKRENLYKNQDEIKLEKPVKPYEKGKVV